MNMLDEPYFTVRVDRAAADHMDGWVLHCLRDGVQIQRRVYNAALHVREGETYMDALDRARRAALTDGEAWLAWQRIERAAHAHRRGCVIGGLVIALALVTYVVLLPQLVTGGFWLIAALGISIIGFSGVMAVFSYVAPVRYFAFVAWCVRRFGGGE